MFLCIIGMFFYPTSSFIFYFFGYCSKLIFWCWNANKHFKNIQWCYRVSLKKKILLEFPRMRVGFFLLFDVQKHPLHFKLVIFFDENYWNILIRNFHKDWSRTKFMRKQARNFTLYRPYFFQYLCSYTTFNEEIFSVCICNAYKMLA